MNKIPWNEPAYGEKRTIYRKYEKWMKDDIKRWRDIPCFWVGRRNMVKNQSRD